MIIFEFQNNPSGNNIEDELVGDDRGREKIGGQCRFEIRNNEGIT